MNQTVLNIYCLNTLFVKTKGHSQKIQNALRESMDAAGSIQSYNAEPTSTAGPSQVASPTHCDCIGDQQSIKCKTLIKVTAGARMLAQFQQSRVLGLGISPEKRERPWLPSHPYAAM